MFISPLVLVGIQGGINKITTPQALLSLNCQNLSNINWSHNPQNLPINEALLLGAKALLKAIDHYSEGAPDYLPSSYTDRKEGTTKYVVHAAQETHVYWEQIEWVSQPGGSPKGWSGTVTAAGTVTTADNAVPTQCFTDCSGFITALFCYANSQHPTQFKRWMKGQSIPEAGCFDPSKGCDHPNPANYYRFFSQHQEGFQNVKLDNLMPGDIFAYANTKDRKDTGHIMLVAAVADHGKDSKLVVVIDESGSLHSCDTRGEHKTEHSGGLGMGIAKLSYSDEQLKFYWGVNSPAPEQGAIALGRAQ